MPITTTTQICPGIMHIRDVGGSICSIRYFMSSSKVALYCGFRYIEPLPESSSEKFEFVNRLVGNAIPPGFLPGCEKGFREAANAGSLIGHPVEVECKFNN